ncbi:MAG: hypothetical protein CMJ52_03635 [Planctomycetaceae bacterium]|nr:hypothetical protein [Planctomycetaceae bacterium]
MNPHSAPEQLLARGLGTAVASLLLLAGCGGSDYDTPTPESVLVVAGSMVENGDAHRLPSLIEIAPRDIEFEDGVTEASAIAEVKAKLAELLGRLWLVGEELQRQFPEETLGTLDEAVDLVGDVTDEDWTDVVGGLLADPFAFLEVQEDRVEILDLGDGTAAVLWDDEPALGGFVAMLETDDGWKVGIPIELVQESDYWPQTRWEWSVVASMLLGIENSLGDFEQEVRSGRFKSLSMAAERAGRIVGESVVVQGVIYAMMKRDVDDPGDE